MSDRGRRNEAILHVLCILDCFLNILMEGLEILYFLVDIFSFHERVRLSIDLVRVRVE